MTGWSVNLLSLQQGIIGVVVGVLLCVSNVVADDRVDSLLRESEQLLTANRYDSAIVLARAACLPLSDDQRLSDGRYARLLSMIAKCYRLSDVLDSSEAYYSMSRQLLEERRERGYPVDSAVLVNVLCGIGVLKENIGDLAASTSSLVVALQVQEKLSGKASAPYLKIELDYVRNLSRKGDYDTARVLVDAMVDRQQQVTGTASQAYAEALALQSTIYDMIGEFTRAEPIILKSVAIMRSVCGDTSLPTAAVLNSAGYHFSAMGNTARAGDYYREALSIREILSDGPSTALMTSLYNLGTCYFSQGMHREAVSYIERAVEMSRKLHGETHPSTALMLTGLAEVYSELGDVARATLALRKSCEIQSNTLGPKHPDYAASLFTLGRVLAESGNVEASDSLIRQCCEIRREVLGERHVDYGTTLVVLGILAYTQGRLDTAASTLEQGLAVIESSIGQENDFYLSGMNTIGLVYSAREDRTRAIEVFQRVAHLSARITRMTEPDAMYRNALFNIGSEYANMRRYDSAARYLSSYLDLKVKKLQQTIHWLTSRERRALWNQEDSLYSMLITMPCVKGDSSGGLSQVAFNSMLIAKALLLSSGNEVKRAVRESHDSVIMGVFAELQGSRQYYSKAVSGGFADEAVLQSMKRHIDSLDEVLTSTLDMYARHQRLLSITWRDIRNNLTDDDVAIEYGYYHDSARRVSVYFAMIVRKGWEYPRVIHLGDERAIKSAIAHRDYSTLYDLVWRPVDSLLSSASTVYYSPAGLLNNVSFAALEQPRNSHRDEDGQTSGVYLQDKYKLCRLTSTRVLAHQPTHQLDASRKSIMLAGGIDYDAIPNTKNDGIAVATASEDVNYRGLSLAPMVSLPATSREVSIAAEILQGHGWNVVSMRGQQADEVVVKSATSTFSPNIIHLATHGFVFPDALRSDSQSQGQSSIAYRISGDPMVRCGVMLSGSNISWTGNARKMIQATGEDGILTAAEAAELDLAGTQLVVLSACKTGVGYVEGNEGTYGLLRGFKMAGVEYVLVSLWSVPDTETMELMTAFYRGIARTNDIVASFDAAQREMRVKYPDRPESWAGFVLVR